ncbi:MAG: outer membrane lipoprotein chaperone LolA [Gammaproteobacteria bacterium]|nr:outer membrane lipoprotein chaperone LolA [Gammaproteobacteria bacterium]
MHILKKSAAWVWILFVLSPVVQASSVDQLEQFIQQLTSLEASFTQTVYDAEGEPLQESTGKVVLKKPGKFRWDYQTPYQQLIVADGEKLWIFDSELEQVTVKKQFEALGQAPIMLLSGDKPLHTQFTLKPLGQREGLAWVELQPIVKDTDFQWVYLGLDNKGIKVMELRDNFNQATQIIFDDLRLNRTVADALFMFTPPSGVDVLGDQ